MTTLPPPAVKRYPDSSIERQVYSIVEKYEEHIPVMNDRNRLGFNLFRFVKGEGDPPAVLIGSAKIKVVGIEPNKLAKLIDEDLKQVKV
jgi:hypothetical protein